MLPQKCSIGQGGITMHLPHKQEYKACIYFNFDVMPTFEKKTNSKTTGDI